jgi:hypothetical protein
MHWTGWLKVSSEELSAMRTNAEVPTTAADGDKDTTAVGWNTTTCHEPIELESI